MEQPGMFNPIITAEMKSVSNYSIWSTFSLHFMNMCCFGFVALIFSIKSRDKKILGDIEAAKRHAQTTKKLNITAIVC
eukprot:gi/632976468/ref/XP_007904811.1/ PREDICTED: dispanin subfamily A member 2b-like [Callorhinchus milii]